MNQTNLLNELMEVIAPYTEETAALENMTAETDFIKDLKINSANLVDIVLDLEEKFGIEIDNDSMARMLNVGTAVEIITTKLAAGAGE